jgi:hypothetical protein
MILRHKHLKTNKIVGGACGYYLNGIKANLDADFKKHLIVNQDNHDITHKVKQPSSRPAYAKSNMIGGKTNYNKTTTQYADNKKSSYDAPVTAKEQRESNPVGKGIAGNLLNRIKIPQQNYDLQQKKKKVNNIKFDI